MDGTCFNHTLIGLDEETIGLVADVLEDGSYDRLIRWLSVSEEAKLNHLQNEFMLGDRKRRQQL